MHGISALLVASLLGLGPIDENNEGSPRDYLNNAIDIIQDRGLNADHLDWESIRLQANQMAQDAEHVFDVYPAIRFVLSELNEHSFLVLSNELANGEASRREELGLAPLDSDNVQRSRIETSSFEDALATRTNPSLTFHPLENKLVAQINIPGAPPQTLRTETLVDRTRPLIETASGLACGYILDFRGNSGGSVWPMALAIQPFLGNTQFGGFTDAQGVTTEYVLRTDSSGTRTANGQYEPQWTTDYRPGSDLSDVPVAVLFSQHTASSGESLAIAFSERDNTRSFGRSTAGFTTANIDVTLSDGAIMVVTVGTFTTPSGKFAPGPVAPDVETSPISADNPFNDETLNAALSWLEQTYACDPRE